MNLRSCWDGVIYARCSESWKGRAGLSSSMAAREPDSVSMAAYVDFSTDCSARLVCLPSEFHVGTIRLDVVLNRAAPFITSSYLPTYHRRLCTPVFSRGPFLAIIGESLHNYVFSASFITMHLSFTMLYNRICVGHVHASVEATIWKVYKEKLVRLSRGTAFLKPSSLSLIPFRSTKRSLTKWFDI